MNGMEESEAKKGIRKTWFENHKCITRFGIEVLREGEEGCKFWHR